MTALSLNINGRPFTAEVEPRTQLAELLREQALLTGTHLGCEHGICGACTVLVDGAPARSCITYAVACEGADITTIEGLDDDSLAGELRSAFREQHALQCGFCTPGMMMTARDIVERLPSADTARIRLELAGNLCRCTGYAGVVKAVRQVLDTRNVGDGMASPVLCGTPDRLGPAGSHPCRTRARIAAPREQVAETTVVHTVDSPVGKGAVPPRPLNHFRKTIRIKAPLSSVWAQFDDVAALSRCMPGAALDGPDEDGLLQGRLRVKLGPIGAAFEAQARNVVDDAAHRGMLTGQGHDRRTGTRVVAEITYLLTSADDGDATVVDLDVRYGLSGTLAQFARGALVENLANRMAGEFAANLERLLGGEPVPPPAVATDSIWQRLRDYWNRLLRRLRGSDA